MSYLVLARKWRPQSFAEVVGQRPVVRTLQNAVARNRVSHAMIFSGVRGVGKTTLARIMAKAINCKEGPTPTPCNQCEACREITAGIAIDLHEIDGASNRGIQEIRELKENIRFFPTKCRSKIIIIDEVHMLTTEAFNALLKTIEEPPAHVYFMFATTELHKIPITILSRSQRFELTRVSDRELAEFFRKVCTAENIAISDWAINQIVREAEGSVRDGLSLLDQVFSFAETGDKGGGIAVIDEDVIQTLGLVDRQVIARLAAALLAGDLAVSLKLLDEIYTYGVDLKRFTNELLGYFRSLLVLKVAAQPDSLVDVADAELAAMKEAAAGHSAETLHNYLQLLLQGVEEMQYAKHPRLILETAFIKTIQAGSVVGVATMLEKLDSLLQGQGASITGAGILSEKTPPAGGAVASGPEASEIEERAEEVKEKKKPEKPAADKAEPRPEPALDPPRAGGKDVRKNWEQFIGYVKERKAWIASVLGLCSQVREEGGALLLKYDAASECRMLQDPDHMKTLAEIAQDFFQKELRIKITIRGKAATSADKKEGGDAQEERRALANDPLVRMAAEIFDAQVQNIRTGPQSR